MKNKLGGHKESDVKPTEITQNKKTPVHCSHLAERVSNKVMKHWKELHIWDKLHS